MLKIKTLTFQNIGRFTDEQTVVFDRLGPLVQVDGVNANTGGSSGVGKSTIFNALDYLFGLNDIPNSLLQSRLSKGSISVSAEFDFDGKPLTITRSKKLSIDLDGEVTSGSSKIAEEKLDQILGVSRGLFRSMLHKRQKEGGFFLALTPKETYDFLTDCLNLTELRSKAQTAHETAADLASRLASKNAAVEAAKAALMATDDAIVAMGDRPEVVITKEAILALKGDYDKAQFLLANLREGQGQDLASLEKEKPKQECGFYDETALNDLLTQQRAIEGTISAANLALLSKQNETAELCYKKKAEHQRVELQKKAKLDALSRTKSEGEKAKNKAVQLANEIKNLRSNVCFTCNQPWATDEAKKKELELLGEMTRCKDVIQAGVDADLAASLLVSEITADKGRHDAELKEIAAHGNAALVTERDGLAQAQKDLSSIKAAILAETQKRQAFLMGIEARNRDLMAAYDLKVKGLRDQQAHLLQGLATEVVVKQRALDVAVGSARSQQEALERFDKISAQLSAQQEAAMKKLVAVTDELVTLNLRAIMAEEAKRAIKAYTSRLFDSALQTISENATRIIRQIPNMANATIQLSATKETGEGKIKEEVNAVLHNDGEENVPLKTLSGGERTSADLAVDLAAIQFLEDQAGKGIDLFILDEPFTGLDSVNIEAIVEMLKASSLSKRIVVVDHNPVIAETFESKILVRRQGSSSSLSA